jgi:hypothetical protein
MSVHRVKYPDQGTDAAKRPIGTVCVSLGISTESTVTLFDLVFLLCNY